MQATERMDELFLKHFLTIAIWPYRRFTLWSFVPHRSRGEGISVVYLSTYREEMQKANTQQPANFSLEKLRWSCGTQLRSSIALEATAYATRPGSIWFVSRSVLN